VTDPIRVVIADDHPVIVDGLQKLLGTTAPMHLVGTARSFAEVAELLTRVQTDVLLLDLNDMGGSALAMMSRMRREHPQVSIVIYSSMVDFAPEMFEAGARGYVTKDELIRVVEQAIIAVAHCELFVSPLVGEYLDQSTKLTNLTGKEQIAIKLLAQGLSTAEIAEQMGVNLHTAQNHITALRRKTGCMQRTRLVDWYHQVYRKQRASGT